MAESETADAQSIIAPLAAWLEARTPGASNLTLHDAAQPSQGYANLTISFVARWTEGGQPRQRELVARIQRDHANPLLNDVTFQWRVMEAIAAAAAAVAVPRLVLAETDRAVLGTPFFLMERVRGRVPQDYPSYHAAGWFAEDLNLDQRQRAWWNGIEAMARLHRIDWRAFPFLAQGQEGTPTARFYLDRFLGAWLDWVGDHPRLPALQDARRRLLDACPPADHAGLVWNDARMGNTMFAEDLTVASLFDFEVASLGPAEIDLAWWLYMEGLACATPFFFCSFLSRNSHRCTQVDRSPLFRQGCRNSGQMDGKVISNNEFTNTEKNCA